MWTLLIRPHDLMTHLTRWLAGWLVHFLIGLQIVQTCAICFFIFLVPLLMIIFKWKHSHWTKGVNLSNKKQGFALRKAVGPCEPKISKPLKSKAPSIYIWCKNWYFLVVQKAKKKNHQGWPGAARAQPWKRKHHSIVGKVFTLYMFEKFWV